jgi:hypothetical protein
VLAFGAEEGISLPWTPKIKVLPRFSRSDLFSLPLPAPQGVVPKKPKALIQVCFPSQTAEVGFENGRKINSLHTTLQASCDFQLSGSVRQRQEPPLQPIAAVTSARGSSGIVQCINGAIQLPTSRQIGSHAAPY